ncbi:phage tail tip fiber protein [Providencia stuartii]|uniref:phage tail tip fiber protein n=1 Tax=Providencia stuartii TaxID=588 RepID=UPI00300D439D
MSDKKEIATLSTKISVDSTDLDKLEAQLKRIKDLMVSVGCNQQTNVGFSADEFFITNGQVFINETLVTSGTITSAKVQGPAIDDALRQAAEKAQ